MMHKFLVTCHTNKVAYDWTAAYNIVKKKFKEFIGPGKYSPEEYMKGRKMIGVNDKFNRWFAIWLFFYCNPGSTYESMVDAMMKYFNTSNNKVVEASFCRISNDNLIKIDGEDTYSANPPQDWRL